MPSFAVFDQLDVISYEEVVQLPAFNRKTLVLIGKRYIIYLHHQSHEGIIRHFISHLTIKASLIKGISLQLQT